jgi:hypothetical protein
MRFDFSRLSGHLDGGAGGERFAPWNLTSPWMTQAVAPPRPVGLPGPVTQAIFTGTASADNFTGSGDADIFDMFQGGNDTVKGKAGNDVFNFGASFTQKDKIDGGTDTGGSSIFILDRLFLDGDYSGGVTFSATTLVNVEAIFFAAGHDYKLTTHDATIAAGRPLWIDGGALGAGDDININGAAETDGRFVFTGGQGVDRFTGSVGEDHVFLTSDTLAVTDRIDGGGGSGPNVLHLSGDFSAGFTFGSTTIQNIDYVYAASGDDYSFTVRDANLAPGERLTFYGTLLGGGDQLSVNASAESDGFMTIDGGPANDTIVGGQLGDFLQGKGGADKITPGPGADALLYLSVTDSTSAQYDNVVGFNFAGTDRFAVPFVPDGIEAAVTVGTLSQGSFDSDLEAAIDNAELSADNAVLFTPDGGNLAGKTFMIVDVNGDAGYQGGEDLVVRLSGAVNLGSFDLADFAT